MCWISSSAERDASAGRKERSLSGRLRTSSMTPSRVYFQASRASSRTVVRAVMRCPPRTGECTGPREETSTSVLQDVEVRECSVERIHVPPAVGCGENLPESRNARGILWEEFLPKLPFPASGIEKRDPGGHSPPPENENVPCGPFGGDLVFLESLDRDRLAPLDRVEVVAPVRAGRYGRTPVRRDGFRYEPVPLGGNGPRLLLVDPLDPKPNPAVGLVGRKKDPAAIRQPPAVMKPESGLGKSSALAGPDGIEHEPLLSGLSRDRERRFSVRRQRPRRPFAQTHRGRPV